LKANAQITFTDGVYLRKETENCKRSSGEIITAIPVGETAALISDASQSICPIPNTDTSAVWAKIKRN
jgi:hypothetical protein